MPPLKLTKLGLRDFKPLTRAGHVLLGVRCAMRVEAWRSNPSMKHLVAAVPWDEALAFAVGGAFGVSNARAARKLSNALHEATLEASNDDAIAAQTFSYTAEVLGAAVEASAQVDARKLVIDAGKFAASIPAMLFHAGKLPEIERPMQEMWDAIRSDLPVLVDTTKIANAAPSARVALLRKIAPLWRAKPRWVKPI